MKRSLELAIVEYRMACAAVRVCEEWPPLDPLILEQARARKQAAADALLAAAGRAEPVRRFRRLRR